MRKGGLLETQIKMNTVISATPLSNSLLGQVALRHQVTRVLLFRWRNYLYSK